MRPARPWITLVCGAVLLLGATAGAGASASASGPQVGRRIVDVLAELSSPQLRFIYSSQLLPSSLRVRDEPSGTLPLTLARAVLAPHGLAVVPVAPGVYAIATATAATRTPAAVAAGPAARPDDDAATDNPSPLFEATITGERYPYGLKLEDDSVLYSATRLSSRPSLGEDALYSLSRQPGLSQGDLSGRLNIRGGGSNETLILLDGFPIREAYHMPGYRGVLSVVDPAALSEVSLYAGAIPARYGDRMSGVLELRSLRPDETPRTSLGIGFLNERARTDIALDAAGDDLLVDARYGATGYLIQALQPAAGDPHYGDFYARLRIRTTLDTQITANVLIARDSLAVRRSALAEASALSSNLGYFWLQSSTDLRLPGNDVANLKVWLGDSVIDSERAGTLNSPGFAEGQLYERRRADIWDLRTELQWPWREQHVLDAGIDVTRGVARYIYSSAVQYGVGIAEQLQGSSNNSQAFDLHPRRVAGSLYVSDSWALLARLTLQAGLRMDSTLSPDDSEVRSWDPRTSLSFRATDASTWRAAWGRVHQVSDLSEIVPGRDPNGQLVSQESEYIVLGYDRSLGHSMLLRIEAFQKEQLHLQPLQRNLLRTPSILPELSLDRVWLAPKDARIRGLEVTLQQSGLQFHWSAAYALNYANETYPQGQIARSGDQRHAATVTVDWTQGQWLAGAALNYRSGLPTTHFAMNDSGGLVIGQRNADRLPGSLGLDLRVKWQRPLGHGTFAATAQVSNLFGGGAVCCTELAPLPGSSPPQVTLRRDGSLPPIPWVGVSWNF